MSEQPTTTPAAEPVLDANGDPVNVPPGLPLDVAREFFACRVPAPCGHYIAVSEQRAGYTKCEHC
jgi:hypothetical protein